MNVPSVEPRLPPWWLDEAPPDPPAPALEGTIDADVAVVGGGYTGLWTALAVREREPNARVVVLEAEHCGAGPSGRNGGFCHGYWAKLAELRELLGDGGALAVAHAGAKIMPAFRAFAQARGDDVWYREGGLLKVSAAPAQDAVVTHAVEAARAVGADEEAVPLTSHELAERIRSPVFRTAVYFRECATVQPARLVRALRRAAVDAGITLHEHTRVTDLGPGVLGADRGRVRAEEIVVATNAWLTGWRPVVGRLTNFGSYVVLTEPVPDLLGEIGWTGDEAIIDGRMFLHYFRTTNDGRVLMGSATGPIGFGGRVDARFSRDAPTAARAEGGLRRLLPGLAAARVERAWGGPIDVSSDHLPFFGTVRGTRIHYGAGYSGHGVGPSWLGGQILASLATGADDEWTALPLAARDVPRLPPEPLRRLGGGAVRAAIMAVERAEEEGRTPPLLARAGAAIPRLARIQIGTR